MTDVLKQLPEASWRGIKFPFTGTRDFGFAQDQAQHRYIFRDQQLIESLGRQNPTFRYQIPFRENVGRGFSALFVGVYPQFLAACLDRSAGPLVDPIHGERRCKCVSFAETLDVSKKDGVDVLVEFVYSPEIADEEPQGFATLPKSIQGAAEQVVQIGANIGELSEEQAAIAAQLNVPAERARVNIFQAARVFTGTVTRSRNQVRANLNNASREMEATRDEIEQAKDLSLEPLRRDASRLSLASRELAKSAGAPPTPFQVVRTAAEIGRLAFATAHQITVDALLEMNPHLADVFRIPAGSTVRVPRRDV